ncbi:MAG: hypothetical protein U1C33_00585, partial [Candidatus Cloacimonadaceae bacterium]|nr:hypothetical protein [Candidatus Cloacimonadaceae bacterium]
VAVLLEQKDLTGESLITALDKIVSNYEDFKNRLQSLPQNDAVQTITEHICRYLNASGYRNSAFRE